MNTDYEVRSSGGAQITLRLSQDYSIAPGAHNVLPANGDRVSVRGTGTTPWRILTGTRYAGAPASGSLAPYVIDTTQLAGNAPAGVNWSPRLAPAMWHAVATDNLGRIVLAADNPGQLRVSSDGGQTWVTGNAPGGLNWVSVAVANSPCCGDSIGYTNQTMLAAAYGGGLYVSYGGASWQAVSSKDPAIDFSNREWEAVVANLGGGGAAAVLNGPIYYTVGTIAANVPWQQATLVGSSVPLVRPWRAMANAGGGATTVAVSEDGGVFVSTDAAHTWVPRPVTIAGSVVAEGWYRVGFSADGNTIAVAGRFNSGLYVSHDQGLTWSRAPTPTGDYTAVSVSGDGRTIAATMTNGTSGNGSVQLSRDGGATFSPATMPGTDTNWRAVAMSSDANFMAVAAGTFTMTTGQLYTSLGNRTTYGVGSLVGGQGSFVDLEYVGSDTWKVRSSSGPIEIR
ncbi:hypothetical protein ACPWT1_21360 [Ramlibacter sp. MMS24-I3-19]|uniref:sialidase family protein n=1 Tax=Ramlibacter sp. MMS24-I3-19 TaxID=3416606 RepID=UPI003D0730A7